MSERGTIEVSGSLSSGALACEIETCTQTVALPVQGTRNGIPTIWRLCRLHGAEMCSIVQASGGQVLHDGWAAPRPIPLPPLRPRFSPPALLSPPPPPPPTPTPVENTMAQKNEPCARCGKLRSFTRNLCATCHSRGKERGIVFTGPVTPEQLVALDGPTLKQKARAEAKGLVITPATSPAAPVAPVPTGADPRAAHLEEEGASLRLAVYEALDLAEIDPEDELDEASAVELLARLYLASRASQIALATIARTLGLEGDSEPAVVEEQVLVALGERSRAVAAANRDGTMLRCLADLVDEIREELGLPNECDESEVLAEVARLVQIERPAIVISAEELRQRVDALDQAEDVAEDAAALELRAKQLRGEERAHRARALGMGGEEVSGG